MSRTGRVALALEQVSKVYELGGVPVTALDTVDLSVAAEEVVILVGPSGSGKTTLLSIAGGLLSPSTGRVLVGGTDISTASPRELTTFRRDHIGFIFQSVNLIPFLTARENLLVVAEFAGRDLKAARVRADRLLDELGLGSRTGNLPAQLSGGERQRVAIGRALMNEPGLVLIDEPTSALDTERGEQVMELIAAEVKARGAAAVIVTHDLRMTRYGDRTIAMADGRLQRVSPVPERGVDRPHHRDATERVHTHPSHVDADRSAAARGRHLPPPPPPPPPPPAPPPATAPVADEPERPPLNFL